jgi:hypothetical protein
MIVLHVLVDLVVTAVVLAEWAWVARKSRALGAIVALGLALRLVASIAVFAVSYFDLGVLKGLHTGGGFWVLAIDARGYYDAASGAAASSPFHLAETVPSPAYVVALALWLRAVGISVLGGILFNIVCYAATVAAVVGFAQVDRRESFGWSAIVVSAFTFSPVLLLSSTQTLKDSFFAMIIAIVCRAAFELFEAVRRPPARGALVLPALAGLTIISVGLVSGVRAYYAGFLWLGLAAGFGALVTVPGHSPVGRARLLLVSTATLVLVWLAIMIGGGPYFRLYEAELTTFGLTKAMRIYRAGFERAGGATNMVTPPAPLTAGVASPAHVAGAASSDVTTYHALLMEPVPGGAETIPINDEDLAQALNRTLRRGARKAYVLKDPAAPDGPGASTGRYAALDAALRQNHIEVATVSLSPGDHLPDDASLVIVTSLPESEKPAVSAFLRRGGEVLKIAEVQAVRSAPPIDEVITVGGLRHLSTGLLAMFVPVSVLKALSVVTFSGGRGLLLLADLDTVFLDLTLVTIVAFIVRQRPDLVARAPSALFTLAVVAVSVILLAYVVTNFGTLFRLRLLVAVPAWMAPLAFRRHPTTDGTISGSARGAI